MTLYMTRPPNREVDGGSAHRSARSLDVIRPALADLGAEIVLAGSPSGEYDLLVVYEAPDDVTVASLAMAVAAAGEVKSAKSARLLSGQEWLESLRKRRIVTGRRPGPAGSAG